ncbi:unnamed protein product [Meganyctiphanes norvegica]|uniref:C2H2-type domain-containing protein n=1 Tax=Meganyctiphanes norvegica TaxID=48144 RepID=A0AAV2PY67_MEGNR
MSSTPCVITSLGETMSSTPCVTTPFGKNMSLTPCVTTSLGETMSSTPCVTTPFGKNMSFSPYVTTSFGNSKSSSPYVMTFGNTMSSSTYIKNSIGKNTSSPLYDYVHKESLNISPSKLKRPLEPVRLDNSLQPRTKRTKITSVSQDLLPTGNSTTDPRLVLDGSGPPVKPKACYWCTQRFSTYRILSFHPRIKAQQQENPHTRSSCCTASLRRYILDRYLTYLDS